MSIERFGDMYEVHCDDCSETLDTEEDDFQDAIRELKRAGWKITKKRNEWHHQCPSCAGGTSDDFEDTL